MAQRRAQKCIRVRISAKDWIGVMMGYMPNDHHILLLLCNKYPKSLFLLSSYSHKVPRGVQYSNGTCSLGMKGDDLTVSPFFILPLFLGHPTMI